jgi:SAM-dependent methyltransferase
MSNKLRELFDNVIDLNELLKAEAKLWDTEKWPSGPYPLELSSSDLERTLEMWKIHGGRWLDFGCGDGRLYPFLREYCDEYYGVDISSVRLADFKAKFLEVNIKCIYTEEIPFPDGFFDVIWCYSVMTHTSEEQNEVIFKEIYRTLRNEGKAIFSYFPEGYKEMEGKTNWICQDVEGQIPYYFKIMSIATIWESLGYSQFLVLIEK